MNRTNYQRFTIACCVCVCESVRLCECAVLTNKIVKCSSYHPESHKWMVLSRHVGLFVWLAVCFTVWKLKRLQAMSIFISIYGKLLLFSQLVKQVILNGLGFKINFYQFKLLPIIVNIDFNHFKVWMCMCVYENWVWCHAKLY